MLFLYQLTLINSELDLALLNTQNSGQFALSTDLTVTLNTTLIYYFQGYFSGAKKSIFLTAKAPNLALFDQFAGILTDVQIVNVQSAFSGNQFALGSFQSATVNNLFYSLKMTGNGPINTVIAPFRNLQGTKIQFLSIKIDLKISGNAQVFGLAQQILGGVVGENVKVFIANEGVIEKIAGLTSMQQSSFACSVEISDSGSKAIFGLSEQILCQIEGVQVRIRSSALGINGIGGSIQNYQVLNVEIFVQLVENGQALEFYGAAKAGNGILRSVSIMVTGAVRGSNVQVSGVCQDCSVMNCVIEIMLVVNCQKLSLGGISISGNSKLNAENVSISVDVNYNSTDDTYVSGVIAFDRIGTLKNFYINISVLGDGGRSRVSSVSNQNSDTIQLTAAQVHFDLRSDGNSFDALWTGGLGVNIRKCSFIDIVLYVKYNLVSRIECNLNGVVQMSRDNKFKYLAIILETIQLHSTTSQQKYFSGFGNDMQKNNVDYFIMYGDIKTIGKFDVSGLSYDISQTDYLNGMLNVQIINDNAGKATYLISKGGSGNQVKFIISYSTYNATFNAYRLLPPLMRDQQVWVLDVPNKNCGSNCASAEQLQDSKFLKDMLKSNFWILDDDNNKMVRLKDFYFFITDLSVSYDILMLPFSTINNQPIIKGLPDSCAFDCHGFKNPESTICDTNYISPECELLSCSADTCNGQACSPNHCQCGDFYSGDFCEVSICNDCFEEQTCALASELTTCSGKCQNCPGICVDDFCVCGPGYSSNLTACDQFECKTSSDCHGQPCIGGTCNCDESATGSDCGICAEGFIMVENECKVECLDDYCTQGQSCFYDDPTLVNWTCESCLGENTGKQCDSCSEDYILDEFQCKLECIQCLSGKCWYDQKCDIYEPVQCKYQCSECKAEISGDKCDQCQDNFTYYEWQCCENIEDGNGNCFTYNDSIMCLSCNDGYTLLDNICKMPCLDQFCQMGEECYYDDNTLETWTCESCLGENTGKQCDNCTKGFILDGFQCKLECIQCLSGTCWFDEECDIYEPVNCLYQCSICEDGISGDKCDQCQDNFTYYDWQCRENIEDGNGNCFTYNDSIMCLSCNDGYTLLDNICKMSCLDLFCQIGEECYYDDNDLINWTCESCLGENTGKQCDKCSEGFILDEFQCKMECSQCLSGTCWFDEECDIYEPVNCLYQCSKCEDSISGDKCDQCQDNFIFYEWKCYEIVNLNGTCINVSGIIVCFSCDVNYTLIDKKCVMLCEAFCVNGECNSDNSCECDPNYYDDKTLCDAWDCSEFGCENGVCLDKVCQCDDNFMPEGLGCTECPQVYNGQCGQDGVVCDSGFQPDQCEKFSCSSEVECGGLECNTGQCQCENIVEMYNNYCLKQCDLSLDFQEGQFEQIKIIENIHHGSVFIINSSMSPLIRENLCVLSCQLCQCDLDSCDCQNVQFDEIQQGKVCQKCQYPYTGQYCLECLDGFEKVQSGCFRPCLSCNGRCFYNDGLVFCEYCYDGYTDYSCDVCEDGFVQIGDKCYEYCGTCFGNCYIAETIICEECETGYTLPHCQECDSVNGYVQVFGGCYKKCDSCTQGYCYEYGDGIACISCENGLIGIQCNLCLNGYVMHAGQCYKQVGENQCYEYLTHVICVGCVSGYILFDSQCYKQCFENQCHGTCFYVENDYQCLDCHSGYILLGQKCYQLSGNNHGNCIQYENVSYCSCFEGFTGQNCEICTGLVINDLCYISTSSPNGDCYVNVIDRTELCISCNTEYILPLCVECNVGYDKVENGSCAKCMIGFINSSTLSPELQLILGPSKCVSKCLSCIQGDCWYSGSEIICIDCTEGFNTTCKNCDTGYVELGAYCVKDEPCGMSSATSETYCQNCSDLTMSFNCSFCSLEFNFGECRQHALYVPGRCFQELTFVSCDNFEPCLLSYEDQCIQCHPEMVHMNNSCWQVVEQENLKFRGDCLKSNVTICSNCEEGWIGALCDSCTKKHTFCSCGAGSLFISCCCELIQQDIGICYLTAQGDVHCNSCLPQYDLEGGQCIIQKSKPQYLFLLIIPLLILLLLPFSYFCLSKVSKNNIKRKINRYITIIGSRVFFIILSQILSIIIAFQDVYINDFYMQVSVNLFSSLPFVVYLFLGTLPTLRHFSYNKHRDFFVFLSVAGVELTFHTIAYFAVPEQLEVSQSIYKLASPPVVLVMFVFFANWKFRQIQVGSIFLALLLPIGFQIVFACNDSLTPSFFSGISGLKLFGGQIMMGIDIIILGLQYYIYEVVLSKYKSSQAILRLAMANFLVSVIIATSDIQQIIESVLNFQVFIFCALTQVLFNILNVIVMQQISAVEFAINSISSAIWVELILFAGTLVNSDKNFIFTSPLNLLIISLSLVLVFVFLVVFNVFSTKSNENHNSGKEGDCFVNGVHPVIKTRMQERKFYKKAFINSLGSTIDASIGQASMKSFEELRQGKSLVGFKPFNANEEGTPMSKLSNMSVLRSQLLGADVMNVQSVQSFDYNTRITKSTKILGTSLAPRLKVANMQIFKGIEDLNQEESVDEFL